MRYLKILFFGACLSCLALQCEKKPGGDAEPVPEDTLYVNDTFLQYWFFPKGSWWVYERIDTPVKSYDTVTVKYRTQQIDFAPKLSLNALETVKLNLKHSSDYYKKAIEAERIKNNGLIQRLHNTGDSRVNVLASSGYKHYFSYSTFFSWPINSTSIRNNSGYYHSKLVDTNSIETSYGKIENTVHLKIWDEAEVWLAKDIGFVKYMHPDGSVWELKDYHIND